MKRIKDVSANNELDFYLDKANIRRQELVTDTIDYIKTIAKDLFEPLEFLNLLWYQKQFVNQNQSNPDLVIDTLRSLPLTDAQKHVLYCFLLKWQWRGGYPVEAFIYNMQSDDLIPNVYKSIEKEFLRYEGSTPEKEHCSRSCSEHELIDAIHYGTIFGIQYVDWWANEKEGGFVYDERQNCYRFVEMRYNWDRCTYERLDTYNIADLTNFPIMARGFVAFLIHKWGAFKKAPDYYDMYYTPLLEEYKRNEQIKPGLSSRNLEMEFYVHHIWKEEGEIKYSRLLFKFLRTHEVGLIQSYIDDYFNHIRSYSPPIPTYANMDELSLMLLKSAHENRDWQINAGYFSRLANVTNNDIHKTTDDINKLKILCSEYGTFSAGYGDLSWSQFTLNNEGVMYIKTQINVGTPPPLEANEQPTKEVNKGDISKQQRTINVEGLKDYFIASFKGMGNNINHFDSMIDELKTDRTAKEFAEIAHMIYRSKQMNDRRPNTFAEWYRIFCKNIDVKPSNGYKPNNLGNPRETLRKLFTYLY
jgi:hypothetical protein